MTLALALAVLASAPLASSPDLGKAEGHCRPGESGPALQLIAKGLKDRTGNLKAEVYPSNDADFLQDDNILLNAGKVFRRAEVSLPASGDPVVCIRVPSAGAYSVILMHDRNANRKFNWTIDGIGFTGNPRLGWSKPKAVATRVIAGGGMTRSEVVMNYKSGLGVAPLK
ncbi:MAG: DUF2141 domain-containing protein [Novosphingobium sp.]